MLTPWEFVGDLTNPVLSFLPKALLVTMLSAVVCGVVGTHVVLRGMAFVGDAVAHAVFPGLAVAFILQGSLLIGGLAAGLVTAVLVAIFSQFPRLRQDSVIGVFFVAAFAVGIVVISRAPGYSGSLSDVLFGSLVGIPDEEVLVTAGVAAVVVILTALLHRDLVAVSLDPELARAARLPVLAVDISLYVLVTLAVVISVRTVGNILVLALLVTPAATARLLTDRLVPMMALSAATGAGAVLVGIYLSWSLDLPAGGTIALITTGAFLLAAAFGPRHGLLARRRLIESDYHLR
ncbi:MAG: anchored repeat-type ABC transporter permease subunit [Dermatophilaceae bacterium]